MKRWAALSCCLLCGLGCKSKPQTYAANDRVKVDAPYANVRVGQNGGAQVRAPFVNVDTRGQAQSGQFQGQPMSTTSVNAPVQPPSQGFAPAGQQPGTGYAPLNSPTTARQVGVSGGGTSSSFYRQKPGSIPSGSTTTIGETPQ